MEKLINNWVKSIQRIIEIRKQKNFFKNQFKAIKTWQN